MTMTSRERVNRALNHQEPDRVPLDLGGTALTGMHVTTVYHLRQALGLDAPGTPVKLVDDFQMLGEIKPDLAAEVGADVFGMPTRSGFFNYPFEDWKPWTFLDVPVLVPGKFNTTPEPTGDIFMYPQGDHTAPPSGRMPAGGYYFDAVIRQEPIDESKLNPQDNLEEFTVISDATAARLKEDAVHLYHHTDKAFLIGGVPGTNFGDIAMVPGVQLKAPKGIRDVEEWYISLVGRPDYIRAVFDGQLEVALQNLPKVHEAVGDMPSAIIVSGTDFGAQHGPFVSPKLYCELFQPYHARVNGWIHEHTGWKTFIHSCGSIMDLIPHFLDAGFDILNPVQTSAAKMDPAALKKQFGDRATFWGGGIDTQRTLPFGTPEQVRAEVKERMEVFGAGGGFIFAAIHNIQAKTPVENLLALYEAAVEYREY